jgi:hypothetical protein
MHSNNVSGWVHCKGEHEVDRVYVESKANNEMPCMHLLAASKCHLISIAILQFAATLQPRHVENLIQELAALMMPSVPTQPC